MLLITYPRMHLRSLVEHHFRPKNINPKKKNRTRSNMYYEVIDRIVYTKTMNMHEINYVLSFSINKKSVMYNVQKVVLFFRFRYFIFGIRNEWILVTFIYTIIYVYGI